MKRISIILLKIYKRIFSVLKKILWKCLYLNSFKCGRGTHFYPKSHITIDEDGKIIIGKHCFFNNNCSINSMDKITIGDDCIVGENVCFYDHNHEYNLNKELIRKQGFNKKEINIGNNCWIGSNVTILSGVNIGNNVIIGAGAVISKSIGDNSVVIDKNNIVIKSYSIYENK